MAGRTTSTLSDQSDSRIWPHFAINSLTSSKLCFMFMLWKQMYDLRPIQWREFDMNSCINIKGFPSIQWYSWGDGAQVHEISRFAQGTCHSLKKQASVSEVWFEKIARKSAGLWSPPMCFDSTELGWGKRCFKRLLGEQMTDKWERARLTCTNSIFFFFFFPELFPQKLLTESVQNFKHVIFLCSVFTCCHSGFFIFHEQCEFQFGVYSWKAFRTAGEWINSSLQAENPRANGRYLKLVFQNCCNRSEILQQIAFIANPACFAFFCCPPKGIKREGFVLLQQQTNATNGGVFFSGDGHEAYCFLNQTNFSRLLVL